MMEGPTFHLVQCWITISSIGISQLPSLFTAPHVYEWKVLFLVKTPIISYFGGRLSQISSYVKDSWNSGSEVVTVDPWQNPTWWFTIIMNREHNVSRPSQGLSWTIPKLIWFSYVRFISSSNRKVPPPNRSDNKEKALARPAASRVVWLVGLVSCPNRKGCLLVHK